VVRLAPSLRCDWVGVPQFREAKPCARDRSFACQSRIGASRNASVAPMTGIRNQNRWLPARNSWLGRDTRAASRREGRTQPEPESLLLGAAAGSERQGHVPRARLNSGPWKRVTRVGAPAREPDSSAARPPGQLESPQASNLQPVVEESPGICHFCRFTTTQQGTQTYWVWERNDRAG
jgi:hypothetical protein